jgi:hypothetical protein
MNLAPLRTVLAGTHRQMDLVMGLSASAIGSAVEGGMPAGEEGVERCCEEALTDVREPLKTPLS